MDDKNALETMNYLRDNGTYRNNRLVYVGNVPFTMKDVLVVAPLISTLNIYDVGGTGEGKTQKAHDIMSLFGDKACFMEGRPDFKSSELLKELNIEALKTAKNDKEIMQLTKAVNSHVFVVDEMNRCPPIIQNYFFNFFDGKLVHQGKVYKLGNNDYSFGLASGNIGNGKYVGTSDSDRALKDRMHMIVEVDYPDFCTTPLDDVLIFMGKKDPRTTQGNNYKNMSKEIIDLHNLFKNREIPLILPVIGEYFHKGLDYLDGTGKHSKRAVKNLWPRINDIKDGNHENKVFPLSKRAIFSAMGLSQAFKMMAELRKNEGIGDDIDFFLDSLKFTVPYSGVLADEFVTQAHNGDFYSAFDDLMQGIRIDLGEKKDALSAALIGANNGMKVPKALDALVAQEDVSEWTPVREAVESFVDYRKENPDGVIKLDSIIEETKKEEQSQ
ncbi:MAG: AAA family ATPase [Nanoarchaeota archaeon]|nr:AAA family ATPase [Nanoarchaeota archaeon]MBU1321641.1 AAA family ATPase [Nanoarchaeota archaeon]MBU1597425.1 AAA family ATPase [Nanoarchaeota archaeon]MBU2440912.1 AAA family ATPase [Nanoarchaeota archaeon]